MEFKSPLEMLYHWETNVPEKVFLRQPINNEWKTWTWKQTGDEVRRMAAALKAMDLPPGSNIAMISKNCAHWIICDLAIMMSGHVFVPLYPNLNANTVRQILEHSESKILFVGKLDDWNSMKSGVPENIKCISFPYYQSNEYVKWDDLISAHHPIEENINRDLNELATIIYTSGTTGMPKGVMHRFHGLSFAVSNAMPHFNIKHDAKFFSYLPLSHVAERLLVEMGGLCVGGEISFSESLEKFQKNLAETQPTVFLGVHRIWLKFQQGILAKMSQRKLDSLLRIPIVSGIVKKKIKNTLGLSSATNIFTGASPTPVSLINWYASIGINLQESYATTEDCCYSHVSQNNKFKVGFVGRPLPQCEVKLTDENEILIKHEALMVGYYKEPVMTSETITPEGFLRTGDEGLIDDEGFLKITGRVKDTFKTAKGKYVAPSPIEMLLLSNTDIEQVCVTGLGLSQPIALVVLSDAGKKKNNEELISALNKTLQKINPKLDAHEYINKIILVKNDWTIENGMLTPSLKIKRKEIEKKYSMNYESWYELSEKIVFEK